MWDLETLGITDSDEVYEEFVDGIEFNGRRYSVRLPWREGHETLPDNYELSLSRMKSQIRKLRKEPGILEEFDAVIREQLSSGVVEKVIEQEEQGGVHYIPHLAVIRKEATTICSTAQAMDIFTEKVILLSNRFCRIRQRLLRRPKAHSMATRADDSSLLHVISPGSRVASG